MDNSTQSPANEVRSYSGDPLLELLINRLHIQPIQMIIISFLTGFGVLSIWYWAMVILRNPDINYRGLYAHYSSSYGDALVVPLIIGVIFSSYQIQNKIVTGLRLNHRESIIRLYSKKIWMVLTLLMSGIVTFFFHLFAVFGPERNWTLPKYGELNAPGWYHGLFMFALLYIVFGYVIRLSLTLWLSFRYKENIRDIEIEWQKNANLIFFFVILIGTFSGLLAADRLKPNGTVTSISAILIKEAAVLGVYSLGVPVYLLTSYLSYKTEKPIQYIQLILWFLLIIGMPILPIFIVFILRQN